MTIHRIKLKHLNSQFIQKLKKQHRNGEQEIALWVPSMSADKVSNIALSEEQFWQLITLLDWKKEPFPREFQLILVG